MHSYEYACIRMNICACVYGYACIRMNIRACAGRSSGDCVLVHAARSIKVPLTLRSRIPRVAYLCAECFFLFQQYSLDATAVVRNSPIASRSFRRLLGRTFSLVHSEWSGGVELPARADVHARC